MAPLADSLARIAARVNGVRGRALYPPFAQLGKRLRSVSRRLRGGKDPKPLTRLPAVHWSELLPANPIYLVEARKELGNVTEGELALLATAATLVQPGRDVVEIGTFDGRTTLNLAINTRPDIIVNTLDLPPEMATQFDLHPSERRFVEKPKPGARFRTAAPPWSERSAQIRQHLGDSATFDFSALYGRAGLVFVDGSHAYEYALADSDTAFKLVAPHGVVIWHDYGVWDGVTRALEEIEENRKLGLRHVRGTSLVVWKS